MYVKFHAVQLMMRLLAVTPAQTQEAVLGQPAIVGRVMRLLEDTREIVRNEALLLLAELSKGNPELQNILAFQARLAVALTLTLTLTLAPALALAVALALALALAPALTLTAPSPSSHGYPQP
jgi:hypothetical protein